MSLATRCPVCSTVFRVVQDQLKVSEGWVRCGRCAKVFNAFEGLFDLERELAAMSSPQVTPAQRVLQDLAERNRSPKPRSEWPADDFDASASLTRGAALAPPHPPAHDGAPPRSPAAPPPRPSGRPPAAPAWPTSRPAGLNEAAASSVPASWAPSQPPPGSAPARGTVPGIARPAPPAAVTTPPASAPVARAPTSPGASAPVVPAGPAAASPPSAVPATASSAVQPAGAATAPPPAAAAASAAPAPASEPAVALHAEPVPVKTDGSDTADSAGSYESLFRSTGELDAVTAHPSSIDIVLEGTDSQSDVVDPGDSRYLSFVQQADKAARWRRPRVRLALAGGAIGLALLLGLQLAIGARDVLASRWPSVAPGLSALCAPLGCRIEPLRRIERLAVESSGLTRIADGPVYRLAMVLRNRGDVPLLLPAIDLSLTDSGGALVSRRVLRAADLGAVRETIAPGQELPLQALLMAPERPLTGYTIEIFYP